MLTELRTTVQKSFIDMGNWSTDYKEVSTFFYPVLCGILISAFSFGIVYMDSTVPGVIPPAPFSPRSKQHYYHQKTTSIHFGYFIALISGIVGAALIHLHT